MFETEGEWVEAACAQLSAAAAAARGQGRSSLALSLAGGRSPEPIYRAMAALRLEGLVVDLWLGDERAVPVGDPERNAAMIARAFATCLWEAAPRLHLWPPAGTPDEISSACSRYEAELVASLGPFPVFDLALLGLGADGHTASLFPGYSTDSEAGRLALPTTSPLPPHLRMTLTVKALRPARRRLFLAKGADKLEALRALEAEDPSIPASLLAGPGACVFYLR